MNYNEFIESGWIPYSLINKQGCLYVRIIQIPNRELNQNFLNLESIEYGNFEDIPIEKLDDIKFKSTKPPSLFIFHMSRTGSTLAVQMMQSLERVQVVSESGVINKLLSINHPNEDSLRQKIELMLDWYDYVLGRNALLVYKFTSWNVFHLNRFLSWYPKTKYLFLYRSPREVLVSVINKPS